MIKEYRVKHKLSQEELAEEIGISNRHLQRLEHNEENTRLSTFKKIVKALNISDIFGYIVLFLYSSII